VDDLSLFARRVRGHGLGRQRRVLAIAAGDADLARLRAEGFEVADERPPNLAALPEHELDGIWFGRRADVDAAALDQAFRALHHGLVRVALDPDDPADRPRVELLLERAGFQIVEEGPASLVGWTKLITPRVAAGGTIFDAEGRVLLCERADGRGWCMPGGFADADETPRQTVVREVREECGLEVEIDRLLGLYSAPAPWGGRTVICQFLCRVVGGDLVTTDETRAFGWFAEGALPAPIFPMHVVRLAHAFAVRRGEATPPFVHDGLEP
jgi:8-oxo-dGTP diphosphatase